MMVCASHKGTGIFFVENQIGSRILDTKTPDNSYAKTAAIARASQPRNGCYLSRWVRAVL